jgi:hypothetical protein
MVGGKSYQRRLSVSTALLLPTRIGNRSDHTSSTIDRQLSRGENHKNTTALMIESTSSFSLSLTNNMHTNITKKAGTAESATVIPPLDNIFRVRNEYPLPPLPPTPPPLISPQTPRLFFPAQIHLQDILQEYACCCSPLHPNSPFHLQEKPSNPATGEARQDASALIAEAVSGNDSGIAACKKELR